MPVLSSGAGSRALTEEQETAAARRAGSMLLAAAAGSGKTSVLVERYVRAVLDDAIDPARILAITFTERAAWELQERIRTRLRDLGRRELARDTESASIGTIHGFCARLLRADPLAAGIAPSFVILEEPTAARLRAAAFTDALAATMRAADQDQLDAATSYGPERLRQIVGSTYAELRSRGQSQPALGQAPAGASPTALAAYTLMSMLLAGYGEAYEQRKRERAALDFDDLELRALRLLEQPPLRARWMERFDMLMVDEFQDTNRRQLALLRAIEGENLFTVGDEWQSIYGFRHADVEVFRQREGEMAGRGASLALTRNFRSRPGIIEVVNTVFSTRFGERFTALSAAREPAAGTGAAVEMLITDTRGWDRDGAGEAIALEAAGQAPAWRQAEARLLAGRLRALVDQGRARPGEIAVLLRSMTDVSLYESALRERGLPTSSASAEIWQTIEVQDAICGLRALANPLDELAVHAVLAGPRVGLRADTLWRLARAGRDEGGGRALWRGVCRTVESTEELQWPAPRERRRLASFHARFVDERRRAGERTLSELVRLVSIGTRPAGGLRAPAAPPPAQPAAIDTLQRLAEDFEALEGRDLRGFVDHVEQLARLRAVVGAPTSAGESEAVRLMSIHAAKGLEFPVVCVADLGRSGGGREAPHLLVEDDRVGLRMPRLDGSGPEELFDYADLLRERAEAEDQEEDRILYVAMTRAREMLLLSGAASFERWPKDAAGCAPIAWIAPALIADLPARLAAAGEPAAVAPESTGHLSCILSSPAGAPPAAERDAAPNAREAGGPAEQQPISTGGAVDGEEHAAGDFPSTDAREEPVERLGVGTFLSYTALNELERCGYRHYLERVLGLTPVPAGATSAPRAPGPATGRARAMGDLTHSLMERLDFSGVRQTSRADVMRAAAQSAQRIDSAACEEIVAMLHGLARTPLAARLARARSLRTEQPFSFAMIDGETTITGVFDAIAHEQDGSCLVIDYKTSAVSDREDLEALVRRDYELQRLIYALAALRDGADTVEVAHWYLHRPEQPAVARFAASELGDLEARLHSRVAAARARGFAVSDMPHIRLCGTCPGRGGLCSWPAEVAMREHPPE
jgi:ATP-dependent helicase/nuclease subunit A